MMMMIPQKNVESSPKKRLKHMCKKKNCGDDDDGTECSFLLTSSSVPSSSTEFSFCICDSEICLEKISHSSVASSSDINRFFFLHMCFRSLFGEDCTFFCGIIIWHQHSFLFACVFQNFVWRRLHILWHHHHHHQHSFLLHVFSEVCLEKFAFCCHHHHHHHHFCFLFFFFMCLRNKTSSCFGSGKPGRQRTIFFTQDGDGDGDGDNSERKRQS